MQVEAFKALSDQNRLRIVEMLRGGELCACKILEALEITQPTLSHHMAILQRCGLVRVRRSGQWSHYSLDPGAFRELSAYLSSLADDSEASGGPVKIDDCRCIYIDNHL
ncbi:MAG: metalloregulator ArsR/SmtB family transcription factor [Thermoplasmata archaeon]|nr:metalloregulator ArsR/SmtB family transcription factor [Thermoplasmata archaeon]